MAVPRLLLTRELMGPPRDRERQTRVLAAVLDLLQTAEQNGTVRHMD